MRQKRPNPVLLDADLESWKSLEGIDSESLGLTEEQVQSIVESTPELLPVSYFDPVFANSVCIGREVGTRVGRIDHLLMSPHGYLTIVETKLWKSPEARRQVVAQIIDYAAVLSGWTFAQVEGAFRKYAAKHQFQNDALHAYVAEKTGEEIDSVRFAEAVEQNLGKGGVLLLIVGDRIKEGVEDIVGFLQATPSLQYRFGLVELSSYAMPGNEETKSEILIVPHVVARTREIERSIVRVELVNEGESRIRAKTEVLSKPAPTNSDSLSKSEFYDRMSNEIGKEIAVETRKVLDAMLAENDLLSERFTPKRLRIVCDLPECDDGVSAVLDFLPNGGVTSTTRFATTLRNSKYPDSILDKFYSQLIKIDVRFGPKFKADGSAYFGKKLGDTANLKDIHTRLQDVRRALEALAMGIAKESSE